MDGVAAKRNRREPMRSSRSVAEFLPPLRSVAQFHNRAPARCDLKCNNCASAAAAHKLSEIVEAVSLIACNRATFWHAVSCENRRPAPLLSAVAFVKTGGDTKGGAGADRQRAGAFSGPPSRPCKYARVAAPV